MDETGSHEFVVVMYRGSYYEGGERKVASVHVREGATTIAFRNALAPGELWTPAGDVYDGLEFEEALTLGARLLGFKPYANHGLVALGLGLYVRRDAPGNVGDLHVHDAHRLAKCILHVHDFAEPFKHGCQSSDESFFSKQEYGEVIADAAEFLGLAIRGYCR